MSAPLLMDELTALGVELRVEDGRLRFRAPEGVMNADLKSRIAANKEALIARLSGHLEADPERISRAPSDTQERLWFVHEMQGANITYNIPMRLSLHGGLDAAALRGSLDDLVRRHQCLRCRFVHDGSSLRLEILRDLPTPWAEEDLSTLPKAEQDAALNEIAEAVARHCFDLSVAPLFFTKLVKLGPEEHVFFLNVHHIAADGWSCGLLVSEIAAGYEARTGHGAALREPAWKFTDYLDWQDSLRKSGAMDADLAYWRTRLNGMPDSTTLPADRPRPDVQTFTGGTVPLAFDAETVAALRAKAREWGASLNHVLLAATAVLISARCGRADIVIGMPLANRTRREIEGIIGMMVNTVPLRLTIAPDARPAEIVKQVCAVCNEALAHGNLPFEKLVGAIEAGRDLSQTPIFQIAYNFLPPMEAHPSFGGLRVETQEFQSHGAISKYDTTFYFDETEGAIGGNIEYSDKLYNRETAEGWVNDLNRVIHALLESPEEALVKTAFGERVWAAQLVGETLQLPQLSPWELFTECVAKAPQAPALVDGEVSISREELNRRAERFSSILSSHGVSKGDRVGILLPRGIDYVAVMLGAARIGAVFVPFDASQPRERLLRMTASAKLTAFVCRDGIDAEGYAPQIIRVGADTWQANAEAPLPQAASITLDDPFYIIFTSGSTGEPKGVLVPWRGINNVAHWEKRLLNMGPDDRISQIASVSFDASILEIWPALAIGATIVFVPELERIDPSALQSWIVREKITIHFSPTPLAEALLELDWPDDAALRVLFIGGQTLHRRPTHGARFRVLNGYGPTETSILVTASWVSPEGTEMPDIGGPITNTTLAILDDSGQPVPVGAAGELYAGGAGVALGYFGNDAATSKSFRRIPGDPSGTLYYKTGDMVRLREDGRLDYAGRRDGQVKLRGFRIETGEVENALMHAQGVKAAVVRVEGDALAAYVETGTAAISVEEIRKSVAAALPAYMVPARITALPLLPRQPSGKIDVKAIPMSHGEMRAPESVPATKETLTLIASAWAELLGITAPGQDDNFFDIGGHSLLLVKLKNRIRELTGKEIGILDLFRNPTIRRQAAFLEGGNPPAEKPTASEPVKQTKTAPANAPIAIIGMAGRFPQAESVEEFWNNLSEGRECISFFSRDELIAAGVVPELADNPAYVPANGVLKNPDRFDAEFFGVPAREAEIMDPQQRLLLEEAWHCFEDAAIDPAQFPGRVGVYVGSSMNGYVIGHVLPRREIMEGIGCWAVMVANDKDFSATRISYKLNLRGPSVSVNTACSTSLVAIHQAVTALQSGQCEMALAGGSCVRSSQVDGYLYEDGGVLSKDGHCRAFDADATGMVGGNAVALVLLKPLDAALADGDPIRAVIRGIAANNDGADKIGFTAPGIAGQTEVVRDALERAGVSPDSVGFIETHGTGTKLGDSIEVAALAANYAPTNARKTPLYIGSVKTNVGHLDSAAGVTGVIKAALCLENRTLAPSLHFKTPNPEIHWPGNAFRVPTHSLLLSGDAPLRCGVSSLGIGGTNVHAILEEFPRAAKADSESDGNAHLLLLSGRGERSLAANERAVGAWLGRHKDARLTDVAHTLAFGRHNWETRSAFCAKDAAEAAARLSEPIPAYPKADAVAFLFTGMGTQKPGMGRPLYDHSPVVRAVIDDCAKILEPVLGLDIRKLLLASPDDAEMRRLLDEHRYGQPTVFALEYALAQFWIDLGIRPTLVAGHSLGEWVGATLAGVFSLPDALRLVALRGKLMEAQPRGAMLAVNLKEEEVAARLPEGLDIATVNALDQIVVAGTADKIEALAQVLEKEEIRCKRLAVTLAAHSSLMEPLLAEFGSAIAAVKRKRPASDIGLVSDTTGAIATPERLTEPDYWTGHLRHCVRFADCLNTLFRKSGTVLLECGPSHTLCNIALRDTRRPEAQTALASLDGGETTGEDEWKRMLETAGALWASGLPVDLKKLFELQGEGKRISLPGYAFQSRRYWLDAVATSATGSTQTRAPIEEEVEDSSRTPADENVTPVERQVIALMRELLGNVRLGPKSDFFLSGGDSLLAVRLASRIAEKTGVKLTRAQVIKTRTVSALAGLIGENSKGAVHKTTAAPDTTNADCLMRLWQGDERKRPIILLHAVGGGIFIYRDLLRAMRTNHPVWGLQSPGLWDDAEPPESLCAQAELYFNRLQSAGITNPLMIGGSSYGGIAAYELDRLYHEKGHGGTTIVMFDSPGPGHMPQKLGDEDNICAFLLAEGGDDALFQKLLGEIHSLDETQREQRLLTKMREKLMPGATETDLRRQMRVFGRNLDNMHGWKSAPTRSRILFFKATECANSLLAKEPELAWLPLAHGGIGIIPAPGNHTTMLDNPNAAFLAKEINRVLSSQELNS